MSWSLRVCPLLLESGIELFHEDVEVVHRLEVGFEPLILYVPTFDFFEEKVGGTSILGYRAHVAPKVVQEEIGIGLVIIPPVFLSVRFADQPGECQLPDGLGNRTFTPVKKPG